MINPHQLVSTQRASRGTPVGFGLALAGVMVLIALPAQAAIINVPADQPTIQADIDAANPGDEVVVAPGTYTGSINFNGKAIIVRSTDPTNPAVVAATIISGGFSVRVVQCISGEGPNSVLNGFVITGGLIGGIDGNGGGMRNVNSSPTVTNCTFIDNATWNGTGGGMGNVNSNPTVTNCAFTGNSCSSSSVQGSVHGGGMYNSGSSPTVTDCAFTWNFTGGTGALGNAIGGGMASTNGSSHEVTNCTFNNNFSRDGGGIGIKSSDVQLSNCTISGNTASP